MKAYEYNNMPCLSGKGVHTAITYFPVKFRKKVRSVITYHQVPIDDWTYKLLQRCCETVDWDVEEESLMQGTFGS